METWTHTCGPYPGGLFFFLQPFGCGSKLNRRGKPQVLVPMFPLTRVPFWNSGFLSSHLASTYGFDTLAVLSVHAVLLVPRHVELQEVDVLRHLRLRLACSPMSFLVGLKNGIWRFQADLVIQPKGNPSIFPKRTPTVDGTATSRDRTALRSFGTV